MNSPDLILVNGDVVTMDAASPHASAVAVAEGRVQSVGDTPAVVEGRRPETPVVDLRGRTVLPGFVDAHVHAFATGLGRRAVDLADATSVADVCRRLGEKAVIAPRGEWILAMYCRPWEYPEKRYPTALELDAVAPVNPVWLCSATFHSSASNTCGASLIRREAERRGWQLPEVRSAESGWFLQDDHHFSASRIALGSLADSEMEAMLRQVADDAAAQGLTTVHCLEGQMVADDRDVTVLSRLAPELPVRVVLYYQTMDVGRVIEMGLPRIGGCLTVDGACSEHTASFYDAYADAPHTSGFLNYSEDRVDSFVREAHEAGLQVAMHAIGDHAIDVLVRAYQLALSASPRPDHRHRIEHYTAPTRWALDATKQLSLAVSLQPVSTYLWDQPGTSMYERWFGPERASGMEPLKWAADEHVLSGGGSDTPVAPMSPLLGLHSAINNPRPMRRLSVDDSLRLFTVGGATLAFLERETGSIEVGKSADLVVIDGSPYRNPEATKDLSVDITICRGAVTHDRLGVL